MSGLAVLVILFLSVEIVLLARQNDRYQRVLMQFGLLEDPERLKGGDRFGDLPVKTLDGTPESLALTEVGERYLLFIFSTSCPHCLANLGGWAEITRRVSPSGRFVVGLSVHGPAETAQYVRDNRVGFYTVAVADTQFMSRYRLPGVPATVLLSPGGIVEQVWIGELKPKEVEDIIHQAL